MLRFLVYYSLHWYLWHVRVPWNVTECNLTVQMPRYKARLHWIIFRNHYCQDGLFSWMVTKKDTWIWTLARLGVCQSDGVTKVDKP